MAGHNKWTQIKRQKAVTDSRKSKLFAVLAKQITLEAKRAAGDRTQPALRQVIEKARAANLPNDNIERALERATGPESQNLEAVFYEAYGPGGVALLIEGASDNKNRTTQEIKHLLTAHQGSLVGHNAALYAFTKTAEGWRAANPVVLDLANVSLVKNLLAALEDHPDVHRVICNAQLPTN